MGILKTIVEFFSSPPPKFKVGDRIYYSNTEFPDKEFLLEIVAVGQKEYQYMFASTRRSKYSQSIEMLDSVCSKVEE